MEAQFLAVCVGEGGWNNGVGKISVGDAIKCLKVQNHKKLARP